MDPEKVPKRINSFSIGAILLIIGLGVLFQVFNSFVIESVDEELDILDVSELTVYGIVAVLSFMVSRRYGWSTIVFGKTYFSLGLAFLMLVIAELIWHYYTLVLQEWPYPSVADVFFFALYPFATYHLVRNCRFFKPKFNRFEKFWLIVIPVVIIGIYSYLSYESLGEFSFDFYYGGIFVTGTSITFAFAILGVTIFRQSMLGVIWLILTAGIFLTTFADVWYYYLEIFELYSRDHIVTALWFTSANFIIYALYKHYRSL